MNNNRSLLIIGAGDHGKVVYELAKEIGCFEKIAFVDDNKNKTFEIIGPVNGISEYRKGFSDCVVSIGNNELRAGLLCKVMELGYNIPILIHPKAYVSPSARIGNGTIIEAMVAINSNAEIGIGCLLSVGAIVDHNGIVEDFCHLDAGSVVKTNGRVSKGSHIDSCLVVESGSVTKAISNVPDVDKTEEWVRKYLKESGTMPTFF